MKAKQNLMLLLLLLLGVLTGCEKEEVLVACVEDAVAVPITALAIDMEQANCSLRNVDKNKLTVFGIITSQAAYEQYVKCGNVPAVDFSKYFLLAGRTRHLYCGRLKAQSLALKCDKLEYTVEIEDGDIDCQAITDVPFFALVPIQYQGKPVVLNEIRIRG